MTVLRCREAYYHEYDGGPCPQGPRAQGEVIKEIGKAEHMARVARRWAGRARRGKGGARRAERHRRAARLHLGLQITTNLVGKGVQCTPGRTRSMSEHSVWINPRKR